MFCVFFWLYQVQLSYYISIKGHSTTMWTKFYPMLIPLPLEWTIVDILPDTCPLSSDQASTFYWPPTFCPRSYWMTPYYERWKKFPLHWHQQSFHVLSTHLWAPTAEREKASASLLGLNPKSNKQTNIFIFFFPVCKGLIESTIYPFNDISNHFMYCPPLNYEPPWDYDKFLEEKHLSWGSNRWPLENHSDALTTPRSARINIPLHWHQQSFHVLSTPELWATTAEREKASASLLGPRDYGRRHEKLPLSHWSITLRGGKNWKLEPYSWSLEIIL